MTYEQRTISTLTCDMCGESAPINETGNVVRDGWRMVDWTTEEKSSSFDLCPLCASQFSRIEELAADQESERKERNEKARRFCKARSDQVEGGFSYEEMDACMRRHRSYGR